MNFSIVRIEEQHAEPVIELMERTHGIAYCAWENVDFLRREIQNPRAVLLAAEAGGRVVGVLLGGAFAKRGMICHLAVDQDYRSTNGIGRRLIKEAYRVFRSLGVCRVHLVVEGGNDRVVRYWMHCGFTVDKNRITLECDIETDIDDPVDIDDVLPPDKDCICEYARAAPLSFHEWQDERCLRCEIEDPRRLVLAASPKQRLAGLSVGGYFGFRGQISHLHSESKEIHYALVEAAKRRFKQLGVLRIHTRIPKNDPALTLWQNAGLEAQEGETTLSRNIPRELAA